MPSPSSTVRRFDFDIDNYLNPIIPRPRLHLLPTPLSRLLGYRSTPEEPIGSLLVCLWAFLGAFTGISLTCLIFHVLPFPATSEAPPIIIASFGATAILEYNSICSPLAQPRNVLLGQALSSITGIAITKAFQLSPSPDFEKLRWLAGALAVATASAVMALTKTVHPPAGATALLAATTPQITDLGWFLVPLVMLGSAVMLLVACLVNNLQRQFPLYWWTERKLGGGGGGDSSSGSSGGGGGSGRRLPIDASTNTSTTATTDVEKGNTTNTTAAAATTTTTTAATTAATTDDHNDVLHVIVNVGQQQHVIISITAQEVTVPVPDVLALTTEEVEFLRRLRGRLRG